MRVFRTFIIAFVMALLATSLMSVAAAHHKDGHEKGGKGHNGGVTEDNDNDGHPNDPDPDGDADNRHPSGKDKHGEGGRSGNQGKSKSDPDGDSNGGADKPGGSGGHDKLDQDGNNGCGNDDDFEDDNNGKCGGPKKLKECRKAMPAQAMGHASGRSRADACLAALETTSEDGDADASGTSGDADGNDGSRDLTAVSGFGAAPSTSIEDGATVAAAGTVVASGAPATSDDDLAQYDSPTTLPFTGMGAITYLIIAGALIVGGLALYARGRRTT